MQTRNPLFNDLAELMTDAFAAAQAAGEEARTAFRAQADKVAARMDLVTREEFEAVKTVAAEARAEAEALKARIAALEARLAPASKAAAKPKTAPAAAAKSPATSRKPRAPRSKA